MALIQRLADSNGWLSFNYSTPVLYVTAEDDDFDTDQGYRGTNQFVFGIHDASGDNGFEMDGGDAD